MTHTPERILRNTGIMIGALSVQKLIALLYFAGVARFFGAEITGEFFFATSVGMLLTVLFDSGQSAILIQESARDMESARLDFRTMLATKLLFSAVASVVGVIALASVGANALLAQFLMLMLLSSIFETLHVSFYGVLRAHQLHGIEGIAGVVGSVIELGVGALVWRGVLPLPMLVGAFLLANVFHVLLTVLILRRRFRMSFVPDFSRFRMRAWIARASPFAVASYFVKVGNSTDSVLLRTLGGAEALGFYSIPFKASFSWMFIPQGFVATLFPAMSFFAREDRERLGRAFERAMILLLFLAAPLALGIAATAVTLIPTVFGGQYAQAAGLSQALALVIFPLFLQYPIGSLLNATDRAAVYTRLLGIAMVVNILANALLIPRFGAFGAATAAILSHSILVVLGLGKATRVIHVRWKSLGSAGVRILGAAVLMFLAVRLYSIAPLWQQIGLGFAIYVATTWLLGVWKVSDLLRMRPIRYE